MAVLPWSRHEIAVGIRKALSLGVYDACPRILELRYVVHSLGGESGQDGVGPWPWYVGIEYEGIHSSLRPHRVLDVTQLGLGIVFTWAWVLTYLTEYTLLCHVLFCIIGC